MDVRTCIIIPCYNEAARLDFKTFNKFLSRNDAFDLCFVNDGSSDNTSLLLQELSKDSYRIHFVNLEVNNGKAEAVRAGFLHVYSLNIYRYIAFADADLATPLSEIVRLTTLLNTNEKLLLVFGSRMERLGMTIKRNNYRHFTGRLFATIINMLFKLKTHDTQCGAKVFDSTLIWVFKEKFISSWLFDVEILLRIKQKYGNLKYSQLISEEPLKIWIEQGDSKIRFKHLLKLPMQICRIYIQFKFQKGI